MNRAHRRLFARHTLADTIAANQDINPAMADTIVLKLHSAFDSLASGSDDGELFDRLAAAVNVGMVRAEGIGKPAELCMLAARDALMDADRICGAHGRFGFTGLGRIAMGDGLHLYEQILRGSTPRQMHLALKESMRRMNAGQFLSAPETTTV